MTRPPPWDLPSTGDLIRLALAEDRVDADRTAEALGITGPMRLAIVAKEEGILAGGPLLPRILDAAGVHGGMNGPAAEGSPLLPGDEVASIAADGADLLRLERVLLNFLQRLCGIASLTRRFVKTIEGTETRVVDTRKTVPGWRAIEKYAVRVGGGINHRMDLADEILIKRNHLTAAGLPAAEAVRRAIAARDTLPGRPLVTCEVTRDGETLAVAEAGAERILLDNFDPKGAAGAVRRIRERFPNVEIEVSGGITLANARAYAEAGADRIAVGTLTHSAVALDLSARLLT